VDPSQIPNEGNKMRFEISMKRLKGHMETLLGRSVGDMAADLETLQTTVSAEPPIVKVQCRYNQKGTRTYKTEFIRELISGAVPANA